MADKVNKKHVTAEIPESGSESAKWQVQVRRSVFKPSDTLRSPESG